MNIDFDKSHSAMNMDDKRNLYSGVLRGTGVLIVFLAILLAGMAMFLTNDPGLQ